jgi:hypothetical protein
VTILGVIDAGTSMFHLFKKLLASLWGGRRIAFTPRETVAPESRPTPRIIEKPSEPQTRYVLPLRWSLHYALTDKQWRGVRDRHKERFPGSGRCSCPKGCNANTLDEQWRYEHATHTKVFLGVTFICPGCHWLKSPTWRVETWLKDAKGLLPVAKRPPHITDCLGWTQERVDALREKDLQEHQVKLRLLARLDQQVTQGQAVILPAPVERLSEEEVSRLMKPGQVAVVPWHVDLSVLVDYGYSPEEITIFEQRMCRLATQRMSGRHGTLYGRWAGR